MLWVVYRGSRRPYVRDKGRIPRSYKEPGIKCPVIQSPRAKDNLPGALVRVLLAGLLVLEAAEEWNAASLRGGGLNIGRESQSSVAALLSKGLGDPLTLLG